MLAVVLGNQHDLELADGEVEQQHQCKTAPLLLRLASLEQTPPQGRSLEVPIKRVRLPPLHFRHREAGSMLVVPEVPQEVLNALFDG
jgi:hypothetical protein